MKIYLSVFFSLIAYAAYSQCITPSLNNSFNYTVEKELYCTDSASHTAVKPYMQNNLTFTYEASPFKNKILSWGWDALVNRHFVEVSKNDYSFFIDPSINFQIGQDFSDKKTIYTNSRGFQLGGNIGSSFSFYSMYEESQFRFPKYIDAEVYKFGVVPGIGFSKKDENGTYDSDGYAEAYISYTPSKYFNFRFGQFKNFWGDGYRSLFLSDNSSPYPQLLITSNIWKIKYVNLFAQMGDTWGNGYNGAFNNLGVDKKMVSAQFLSWDVTKRWNLNFFEAIIYQTYDTNGNYNGLTWSYLNPVIFLRPAEFQQGSPDNVIMGIGSNYRIGKNNILYTQFVLSEFKIDEIRNWSNGWWGNQNGFQLGCKLFDVFNIENLYFQAEYNTARPYMYSDKSSARAWGQYNMPLAHPTGANFQEGVGIVKYNYDRFFFEYKFNYLMYGADTNQSNWGKNIFIPYAEREKEYGNFTGQGVKTSVIYNNLKVSYLVNPFYNLNIYAGISVRNLKNNLTSENTSFIYFGVATTLRNYYYDF